MSNIWAIIIFVSATVSAAMATKKSCTAIVINPPLSIKRGRVKSSYIEGEWIFYTCAGKKHYLSGNALRMCRNGSWTGRTPGCVAKRQPKVIVKCKKIYSIRHGQVLGSRRRSVKAVINFKCSQGYNLMGRGRLTCLTDGKWDGPVPKCIKDVPCTDPGTPANGHRLGNSFRSGKLVLYWCDKGYRLSGTRKRTCRETGKWSGVAVQCTKIDYLKDVADNLRKHLVNKFGLVTTDSRARAGISSGASGLDFVFVLDSSASVGQTNFKRGIEFAQTIIGEYGVSTKPQGTRVAIVTFNSQAEVKFNLKTNVMNDTDQAMKELGNIAFQGGGTNTAGALDKVYHTISPEARDGSHKVLFLITDGRSNVGKDPRQFAERLRGRNFEIFAVGITSNADKNELQSIASQPYRSHVYLLSDYKTLEKLKNMITGDAIDKWACGLAGDTGLRAGLKTPGHRVAKEDAWPWQAVIYVQSAVKCGGTLIADNWVLTAAKCFNGKKIKNLTNYHVEIALGEHDRLTDEGTEQSYDAIKIIRPPRYFKKRRDDLALVKLKYPVKQTAFVHSICYDNDPTSSLIWPTEYGVITGWGSRKQSKNRSTVPAYDELQQTVVKFVSGKACQQKMKNNFRGNVFCASSQDDTVDECLGDTGGPVVAKRQDQTWTLVGVTKINEGCDPKDRKYSLFTKVGHYATWMSETILNN